MGGKAKEIKMILIENTVKKVRETVKEWKSQGLTVGLVPTMGYLHEGHQSLIKKAVNENDRVVVSIFVNPIQFAPNEDLETYPRDLEKDSLLCNSTGADLIFHPQPEEMYPDGFSTQVVMNNLTTELCGKTRPTHFSGVCTVVSKLFNIVKPDRAYFGEKDAQQLAIIKRMVKDLNLDIEIVGCPIVREADGLAKSSRNTYLNSSERKAALILSKSIQLGKKMVADGEKSSQTVINAMTDLIKTESLAKIDYVSIVNAETIEPVDTISGEILTAVAVYIGKTRLIDNFMITV